MLDAAALILDVAGAFEKSHNFRTLLGRLARSLERHMPVVEVEVAEYIARHESVFITVYSPDSGRRWRGTRSRRYLSRRALDGPQVRAVDGELSRIDYSEVSVVMEFPVRERVLISISLSEMPVEMELGTPALAQFSSFLSARLLRLDELAAVAERCRLSHRNTSEMIQREVSDSQPEPAVEQVKKSTDISAYSEPPLELDAVITAHLCRALEFTQGKIYGDGGAAELLGLKPSTLQSKLRKYGIDRARYAEASQT